MPYGTVSHLPAPVRAKWFEADSLCEGRMLAEKWATVLYTSKAASERAGQNSTRGGSSDTEVNELAVIPTSPPSSLRAPITTMPVANMPNALRSRLGVGRSDDPLASERIAIGSVT